jgi:hypothetical protein
VETRQVSYLEGIACEEVARAAGVKLQRSWAPTCSIARRLLAFGLTQLRLENAASSRHLYKLGLSIEDVDMGPRL